MADLRALVVPGVLLAVSSGFRLLRYRKWRRTDAMLLEKRFLGGEDVPDYLKVRYVVDGAPYVAELTWSTSVESAGSKVGDIISIYYDPLNPMRRTTYNDRYHIIIFIVGLALIIAAQMGS